MRGQVFTFDTAVAVIIVLVVMQVSLTFLYITNTGTVDMVRTAGLQRGALIVSEMVISNATIHNSSGSYARTIDTERLTGLGFDGYAVRVGGFESPNWGGDYTHVQIVRRVVLNEKNEVVILEVKVFE